MVIFQFFADLFSRTFPKDQKCLFMVCNYMDKILTSSMQAALERYMVEKRVSMLDAAAAQILVEFLYKGGYF